MDDLNSLEGLKMLSVKKEAQEEVPEGLDDMHASDNSSTDSLACLDGLSSAYGDHSHRADVKPVILPVKMEFPSPQQVQPTDFDLSSGPSSLYQQPPQAPFHPFSQPPTTLPVPPSALTTLLNQPPKPLPFSSKYTPMDGSLLSSQAPPSELQERVAHQKKTKQRQSKAVRTSTKMPKKTSKGRAAEMRSNLANAQALLSPARSLASGFLLPVKVLALPTGVLAHGGPTIGEVRRSPVVGGAPITKENRKRKSPITHHDSACSHCGTQGTSLWRRTKEGAIECNSCELYFRKNGVKRPSSLFRKEILKRNRARKAQLASGMAENAEAEEMAEDQVTANSSTTADAVSSNSLPMQGGQSSSSDAVHSQPPSMEEDQTAPSSSSSADDAQSQPLSLEELDTVEDEEVFQNLVDLEASWHQMERVLRLRLAYNERVCSAVISGQLRTYCQWDLKVAETLMRENMKTLHFKRNFRPLFDVFHDEFDDDEMSIILALRLAEIQWNKFKDDVNGTFFQELPGDLDREAWMQMSGDVEKNTSILLGMLIGLGLMIIFKESQIALFSSIERRSVRPNRDDLLDTIGKWAKELTGLIAPVKDLMNILVIEEKTLAQKIPNEESEIKRSVDDDTRFSCFARLIHAEDFDAIPGSCSVEKNHKIEWTIGNSFKEVRPVQLPEKRQAMHDLRKELTARLAHSITQRLEKELEELREELEDHKDLIKNVATLMEGAVQSPPCLSISLSPMLCRVHDGHSTRVIFALRSRFTDMHLLLPGRNLRETEEREIFKNISRRTPKRESPFSDAPQYGEAGPSSTAAYLEQPSDACVVVPSTGSKRNARKRKNANSEQTRAKRSKKFQPKDANESRHRDASSSEAMDDAIPSSSHSAAHLLTDRVERMDAQQSSSANSTQCQLMIKAAERRAMISALPRGQEPRTPLIKYIRNYILDLCDTLKISVDEIYRSLAPGGWFEVVTPIDQSMPFVRNRRPTPKFRKGVILPPIFVQRVGEEWRVFADDSEKRCAEVSKCPVQKTVEEQLVNEQMIPLSDWVDSQAQEQKRRIKMGADATGIDLTAAFACPQEEEVPPPVPGVLLNTRYAQNLLPRNIALPPLLIKLNLNGPSKVLVKTSDFVSLTQTHLGLLWKKDHKECGCERCLRALAETASI